MQIICIPRLMNGQFKVRLNLTNEEGPAHIFMDRPGHLNASSHMLCPIHEQNVLS